MSLTSFIKEPDVRAKFKQTFPLPKVFLNSELKAPPITSHYAMVGTAFDYLLRFYIKKNNPLAKAKAWVAESALECECIMGHPLHKKFKQIVANSKSEYEK